VLTAVFTKTYNNLLLKKSGYANYFVKHCKYYDHVNDYLRNQLSIEMNVNVKYNKTCLNRTLKKQNLV